MNKKQQKKLLIFLSLIAIIATALGLILYALKQNINLFYTPSQLLAAHYPLQKSVRIGGYVKKQSISYYPDGKRVKFIVTDHQQDITVKFAGILPNLFREEQGVVITGKLIDTQIFIASEVLAKHDEKYMPLSLEKTLKTSSGQTHDTSTR